jgi:hypothetical protein
MKLKTKKLIAREFIILCIVCSTGIIAYFLILANNAVNQKKSENLNKVLAIKVGQLNTIYLKEDEPILPLIFNDKSVKILQDFDLKEGRHLGISELKNMLCIPNERRLYFMEFNSIMKFKNYNDFLDLILTKESSTNYTNAKAKLYDMQLSKSFLIQSEIDKIKKQKSLIENNILPLQQRITASTFVALIAFTVLMLFRYLYYSISWSIITLKKKEVQNI